MISIRVKSEDLLDMRFSYSPLLELVMSYRWYLNPKPGLLHKKWIDEARTALRGIELAYMDALILPQWYVPDFLTPTPTYIRTTIESELERVSNTPEETIRKNMQFLLEMVPLTEIRRHFLERPHEALDCLIAEMRLYWQRCLAQHWPKLNAVLEGDILYRARQLALEGPDLLLNNLAAVLKYQSGELSIVKKHSAPKSCELQVEGRGIQLVPLVFSCTGVAWQFEPEWAPMLMYTARGGGLWYQTERPEAENSLKRLLGPGRARVLQALTDVLSTGELAARLHVTPGAISQHLTILQESGLVESNRSGTRVYYHLTPRGAKLLTLFDE